MADVVAPHEKQMEQLQPQIEGAPEASSKLASAGDASSGVKPLEPGNENEKLKIATGQQEQGDALERKLGQAKEVSGYSDQTFMDKQGHPIQTRTWQSGDLVQVRAYDQTVQQPKETPDLGQAGSANLALERDWRDGSTRARLNDIETPPDYRGSGIGSHLLGECEQVAGQRSAREIYGAFVPHGENPAAVREFYQKHGYSFRPGAAGGEEVFKQFN